MKKLGIAVKLKRLAILNLIYTTDIDLIIIDEFAKFSDNMHKHLGEYIYNKYYITVIGVAKSGVNSVN